ncbi:recombination protein RecT [Dyella sp. SG562]|uniref:RecT family recombinase n=1 Tax=Dyella sp. SG562 TaxID=2587017 RepID=UPI0014206693|nr:RecT family recombinase [Dyella sp. SG562]NII73949.1 recombination protein RecT [Dyella sp. SG562]
MNEMAPYQTAIQKSKDRFTKIAATHVVNYDKESIFAMQMLMKTDYAMQTANNNPYSVQLAMINVASTGLTLNPANGYAYLVPRDGQIVLDISYKGLIKIATDSGSILWARADIVYQDDSFAYNGPAAMPEHRADAFKADRGPIVGAYCVAKTKDGDILCETMPIAELEKIRQKSSAYAKKKAGPWVEWFEQMAKKAVIKRASKTWPYTDDRLAQAIEVANTSEGGYELMSDEEKEAQALLHHQAAVGRNWRSVYAIKEYLLAEEPDAYAIAELWYELPQEEQRLLWRAPSKGGCFTTDERSFLKEQLPKQAEAIAQEKAA